MPQINRLGRKQVEEKDSRGQKGSHRKQGDSGPAISAGRCGDHEV
jgi:hypothetical protein